MIERMTILIGNDAIEFYDARAGKSWPGITVRVCGKRRSDTGEAMMMSAVANRIMKFKSPPKSTRYWTYNGRQLIDVYSENYPSS